MLLTKLKVGSLVPGKKIFKVFIPYMGMAAILVMLLNFHCLVPKRLHT